MFNRLCAIRKTGLFGVDRITAVKDQLFILVDQQTFFIPVYAAVLREPCIPDIILADPFIGFVFRCAVSNTLATIIW
jgi:hypothetical protein